MMGKPDIGAYEHNGDYWVPGITWDLNDEFGENFLIPDSLYMRGCKSRWDYKYSGYHCNRESYNK